MIADKGDVLDGKSSFRLSPPLHRFSSVSLSGFLRLLSASLDTSPSPVYLSERDRGTTVEGLSRLRIKTPTTSNTCTLDQTDHPYR